MAADDVEFLTCGLEFGDVAARTGEKTAATRQEQTNVERNQTSFFFSLVKATVLTAAWHEPSALKGI